MKTTKTGPSIFTALEAAVKPLAESLKVIEHNTAGLSVERQAESDRAEQIATKTDKKRNTILGGMWESIKERGKKSWLADNWGKILIGIGALLTPLEWIKKLWEWVQIAWDFSKEHPLIASIVALTAYFTTGPFLTAIGSALGSALSGTF